MPVTRPLSDAERATLARAARRTAGAPARAQAALLAAAVIVAALAAAARAPEGWGWVVIAVGLVAAVVVAGSRRPAAADVALAARLGEDLAAGVADEERFVATRALVADAGEESASAFLRLADGRVLYLGGRYLHDALEGGGLPAEVRVARAPRAGLVLGVALSGTRVPAEDAGVLRSGLAAEGSLPADGDLLDVPWDAVPGRYLAPRRG